MKQREAAEAQETNIETTHTARNKGNKLGNSDDTSADESSYFLQVLLLSFPTPTG